MMHETKESSLRTSPTHYSSLVQLAEHETDRCPYREKPDYLCKIMAEDILVHNVLSACKNMCSGPETQFMDKHIDAHAGGT